MEFHNQNPKKIIVKAGNLQEFISKIFGNWYWFLISMVVCGGLGFAYCMYASPVYKINSAITIDDQANQQQPKTTDSNGSMSFPDLLTGPANAYNEVDILKSKYLMMKVVRELNLNTVIYRKDNLKSVELYNEAPFDVKVIEKADSIKLAKFGVEIVGNDLVHITNSKENLDAKVPFGKIIKCEQFDLVINKKPGIISPGGYKFTVQSVDSKVENLLKNFTVDLTDKKSSTLALTIEYSNPKKGEALLQRLMTLYLESNLENKKQIADSTLTFIDNRLKIVSGQLAGVETGFSQFKKKNNIANVDEQSKVLVGNASEYNKTISDQEVQLSVMDDIAKYIEAPENRKVIPSSLALQDPAFTTAINNYNQLLLQRSQLSLSYKASNPVIENLDAAIETARQAMLKNFNINKSSLEVSIAALKKKSSSFNDEIKSAPAKEMVFLDYSRQQNLKQQLYLYLLQKREETAISKTSTISTARIIDPAKGDYDPYKPNKPMIYALAIFLGLFIPWAYMYFRELLGVRVQKRDDIVLNTNLQIVGEIDSNKKGQPVLIGPSAKNNILEQLRDLRTNVQLILNNEPSNVVLITSSMKNEGKTFMTLNLANVIAMGGKKVVMIELDLRNPKLSSSMGIDHENGYTDFVTSDSMTINDIIKPTEFSENVFLISSGFIPPNPAELLLSDKLEKLIDTLKQKFDYVVIDSPPIGVISDAQIIEKYVDFNLYITRLGYTYKSQIAIVNDLVDSLKFKRTYLVINDIKSRKGSYYGYDSGYRYGYTYYRELSRA